MATIVNRNQVRTWFLTYPKAPEHLTKEILLVHLSDTGDVKDYVIAKEAHEDGTPHFHVYLKYASGGVRRSAISVFDLPGGHYSDTPVHGNYQACRGPAAVVKYVTKDGDWISNITNIETYGTDGKRAVRQQILDEGAEFAVANLLIHPKDYLQLKRSLDAYGLQTMKRREFLDTRGMWIHGATGMGKTHFALDYAKEHGYSVFSKDANKWWDGYSGENLVLIDDVSPDNTKYLARKYKLWMDKWNLAQCEVKCGTIPTDYDVFCITSQYTIEECFDDPRDAAAIRRRCRGRIYHARALGVVVLEVEEEQMLGLDGGGGLHRNLRRAAE